MPSLRVILTAAAILVAGSASAFQEQQQVTPSAPAKPAQVDQSSPAVAQPPVTDVSKGTEVRVPGFGRLGVLPKIDFGLELLYGGSGEAQRAPQTGTQPVDPTDGMALRGSIRHKF